MGTIGFSGRIGDGQARSEALGIARTYAQDMEWTVHPHEWTAARARRGQAALECPSLAGLLFAPHFACDAVPLLFLDTSGELMELPLRQDGQGCAVLESQVLIRTLFAGPAVHREVAGLLDALDTLIEDLQVEDESDWVRHRDDGLLERAFRVARQGIASKIADMDLQPGDPLSLGGASITRPGAEDGCAEFDRIAAAGRDLLLGLEESLLQFPECRFLLAPGAPAGLDDLELVISDLDPDFLSDPDAVSLFSLAAGARCGRDLIARLGGHWDGGSGEGFSLRNLGGVGIECDPFQLVVDRLAGGTPFSLVYQSEFLSRIVEILDLAGFRERAG